MHIDFKVVLTFGCNMNLITFLNSFHLFLSALFTQSPCAAGWQLFNSSCYFFSRVTGSWETGRRDCRINGTDLVIVNSTEEQNFISRFNKNSWIGLSDLEEEGTWKWVDGSPLTQQYWSQGEPNHVHDEDCVHMHSSTGLWADVSCDNSLYWICEKMGMD
uniref:C-type lectin domain-containing protein n=1 Tax=Sphaeramia orbicularis TaxID=375764 RepID=A0A672Y7T9_9TELE